MKLPQHADRSAASAPEYRWRQRQRWQYAAQRMSFEGFVERLTSLVRTGSVSTNQARVLRRSLEAADVTDELVLAEIVQAMAANSLSVDQLNVIVEREPRFADAVRVGLRPLFGEVTPRRFQDLARYGHLTRSVIERALS